MEWGLRVGQGPGFKPGEQCAVQRLGEVVTALVGLIDAPLHAGEFSVGCARGPCLILNVPEVEVGPMVALDRLQQIVSCSLPAAFSRLMPCAGAVVVQLNDCFGR